MLSQRLLVMHNLWFYNLMQEIRDALDNGTFEAYRAEYSEKNETTHLTRMQTRSAIVRDDGAFLS